MSIIIKQKAPPLVQTWTTAVQRIHLNVKWSESHEFSETICIQYLKSLSLAITLPIM